MVYVRVLLNVDSLVLLKGSILFGKMFILHCLGINMVKVWMVFFVIEDVGVFGVLGYPKTERENIVPVKKSIELRMLKNSPDNVTVEGGRLVTGGWLE